MIQQSWSNPYPMVMQVLSIDVFKVFLARTGMLVSLAALLLLIPASCTQRDSDYPAETRTVISGIVANMDVYPDYATMRVQVKDFRGNHKVYVDSIGPDGSFHIEFDLYHTQDISVLPIVRHVLARPGDSIHIELDFERLSDIIFAGDFSRQNEDYHAYVNSYYLVDYYQHAGRDIGLDAYLHFCDSIYDKMQLKYAEYRATRNPGREVQQWISDHLKIRYYMAVFQWLIARDMHREAHWGLPETHHGIFAEMESLFRTDQMHSGVYGLMNTFLAGLSATLPARDDLQPEAFNQQMIESIEASVNSDLFRQMLTAYIYYRDFSQYRVGFYEQNPGLFSRLITDMRIQGPLLGHYRDVRDHLDNPHIRHKELMQGMRGTLAHQMLDSIFSAHEGKVIYMDFWTTWCAPCIALFPKANEMINAYHDQDIVFIFICMGSSEEQWAALVDEANLDAYHLYATREHTQSLYKELQIGGHPYYMLADKNGFIVHRGFSLTPMTPQTLQAIDLLLDLN